MKTTYNSEFTIWIDGEEVDCVLHSVELLEDYDCRSEYVGHMTISIEGSEEYTNFAFTIWGNGEVDDEYEKDFGGCYVCLPSTFDEDEDDDTEVISYDDMMWGM